jgi:hypothetical protein
MASHSTLKLTDEQRKKIASDLGLSAKLEKVPETITIVGVKSEHLGPAATEHGADKRALVIA